MTPRVAPDLHTRTGQPAGQGALSFGVEEEFLLLDPLSGEPVPAAASLLRRLAGEPGAQAEFLRYQIETATPVCTRLDELRDELMRLRRSAAAAAAEAGCLLVASGYPPYGSPSRSTLTRTDRYRRLARRFPALVPGCVTCGCHVHVGVPTREAGVEVLARLRPWLAPLLALSANSPMAKGRDTGWASWRYRVGCRWPTVRAPKAWRSTAEYDAAVARLIRDGAALDESSVYFLARLSPRYPTVEVRVADTCLDVDTAVLLAGLVRGLVATALAHARDGVPTPATLAGTVGAGLTSAARHGLRGRALDPYTRRPAALQAVLCRLLDHVGAALTADGDIAAVTGRVSAMARSGTGSDRQRIIRASTRTAGGFVNALADASIPA